MKFITFVFLVASFNIFGTEEIDSEDIKYKKRQVTWNEAEDIKLKALAESLPDGREKWVTIAKTLGKLSSQCHERYNNCLDPLINNSRTLPEEVDFIKKRVAEIGTKWVQIAAELSSAIPFVDAGVILRRTKGWVRSAYNVKNAERNHAPRKRKYTAESSDADVPLIVELAALSPKVFTPWTEEDNANLLKIKKENPALTWKEISEHLGRSYDACKRKYKMLTDSAKEQVAPAFSAIAFSELVDLEQQMKDYYLRENLVISPITPFIGSLDETGLILIDPLVDDLRNSVLLPVSPFVDDLGEDSFDLESEASDFLFL